MTSRSGTNRSCFSRMKSVTMMASLALVAPSRAHHNPVLLDELKRIGGPVLGPRFDHVEVADDENRPLRGTRLSMIARDQIALPVVGSHDDDVGCGESGVEQALRHRLRCDGGTSDRVRGVDLDQLFEDVVRALLLSLRAFRCSEGLQADRHQQGAERCLPVAGSLLGLGTGTMGH